jgi:hypothetical protein
MADINVQRKSSNALWWILGLIALLVLLWFIFAWGTEPAVMMNLPLATVLADVGLV